jgi:hypothetical protein
VTEALTSEIFAIWIFMEFANNWTKGQNLFNDSVGQCIKDKIWYATDLGSIFLQRSVFDFSCRLVGLRSFVTIYK